MRIEPAIKEKPNARIIRPLLKVLKYNEDGLTMEGITFKDTKITISCSSSAYESWKIVHDVVKKESPNPETFPYFPRVGLVNFQGQFLF